MSRYIFAIFFAVGLILGITITGMYKNSQIKSIQLDLQTEAIKERDAAIAARDLQIAESNTVIDALTEFNKTKTGELNEALAKNRDVADSIARGDLVPRVRVKPQACSPSPFAEDPTPGSMGDEFYAELDPVARQDFLNLRAGIIQLEGQVSYLQGYIPRYCK